MEDAARRWSLETRRRLVEMTNQPSPQDDFWGHKGRPGDAAFGKRTGRTAQRFSPGGVVLRSGNVVTASVGSPDASVAKMEQGGTISGKPYLFIPTKNALTPSGAPTSVNAIVNGVQSWRKSKAGDLWRVLWPNKGGVLKQSLRGASSWRGIPPLLSGIKLLGVLKRSVHVHRYRTFENLTKDMTPRALELGAQAVSLIAGAARG
jgi:hypothetical protein